MEKETKTRKKGPFFKRIKYYFTSEEKKEALLFDYMQKHPELTPAPPTPPAGEFQKIMVELEKRDSESVVKKRFRKLSFVRPLAQMVQKPTMIALALLLLLGYISVGMSAKKAYDYRLRQREAYQSIGLIPFITLTPKPHIINEIE